MLVFKFTCDEAHHLNTKIISDKFAEAIGPCKDIKMKEEPDVVKLYLGQKNSNNISISIEITDEDLP